MKNEEELKSCQQRVSELEVENSGLKIDNNEMKDILEDIRCNINEALKS